MVYNNYTNVYYRFFYKLSRLEYPMNTTFYHRNPPPNPNASQMAKPLHFHLLSTGGDHSLPPPVFQSG